MVIKNLFIFFLTGIIFSCNSSNKLTNNFEQSDEMPDCLQGIIKQMSNDLSEGMPLSITRFDYHGQKVYYMVAPCCDKYNIVYDSACAVLGYPDGGFTGRGDGKMQDFEKEAIRPKIIWKGGKPVSDSSSTL